ncbi:MFS transporter [Vibrio sp. JC009]|uniref:MFS transporter n=1 Tax=Vibrio sp. JC009 TaxID=2912314 RepID=UPI0023B1CA8B|nr:MFS transporter [Vibrio sp. JC009]WED23340.1 MFS transporter [Vibrio sp. JC009]
METKKQPSFKFILTLCGLYLVQGLPMGLAFNSIPTLLRTLGFALEDVGMIQIAGIFWALKFLWSAQVDNYWCSRIGKRKTWIIPMQLTIAIAIFLLSFVSVEQSSIPTLSCILVLISFAGATQDIATDGFAAENSQVKHLSLINTIQMCGVLSGMLIAGPFTLALFEKFGFSVTCQGLSLLVVLAMTPIIFWPETRNEHSTHSSNSGVHTDLAGKQASLRRFWRTPNAKSSLLLCSLTTVNGVMILGLIRFVLTDRNWSMTDIGVITGIAYIIMTILGCLIARPVLNSRGFKFTLATGLCMVILGGGLWAVIAQTMYTPTSVIWMAALIVGLGMGLVTVSTYTYTMRFSQKTSQPGTNIATFQSAQTLNEIIFTSVATALASTLGYSMVFILGNCIELLCLITLLKHKYYEHVNLNAEAT